MASGGTLSHPGPTRTHLAAPGRTRTHAINLDPIGANTVEFGPTAPPRCPWHDCWHRATIARIHNEIGCQRLSRQRWQLSL